MGNVGHRSKRGRHTTRSAVLLDLPAGGLLVDTPGFNYPAMEAVTPSNVQQFFPEIARINATKDCKFANCTHIHEPQCALRDMYWQRYPFYMRCASWSVDHETCSDAVSVHSVWMSTTTQFKCAHVPASLCKVLNSIRVATAGSWRKSQRGMKLRTPNCR